MTSYIRAAVAAVISSSIVWTLNRRIPAERFHSLKWAVAVGSGLLWGMFVSLLVAFYWEDYFTHIKPAWSRWALPFMVVPFYALLGLAFWWLAARTRRPVLVFCGLGAFWSIPEHLLGIYQMHILDIPLLQGETALSILTFAVFEYLLVWAAALGLAAGLSRLWLKPAPA